MKLNDITPKSDTDLSAIMTFALSNEAKRAIAAIAKAKNRTASEVVREIVDAFLKNNQEELKAL